MRLKNIPGAKEHVDNSEFLIVNKENYKGNYRKLFNNDNPLHIEIGIGKGNFIYNMAKNNPDINFIGIEKYDSVMVKAVEKLESESLPNLRLIKMDATNIDKVFFKEVDVIYLNFSDPWPKNRHENRRLSSRVFLEKYDNLFKNNKTIIMKTDNRKLFEFSIISFTNYNYKIEELSLDLYNDDISLNIPTEYEIKFVNKGNPIYRIKVSKENVKKDLKNK